MTDKKPRKLPTKYLAFVLPFIISIFMSCLVSGIATLRSIGMAPDFLHTWMTAWGISWVIAFPALLIVLPIARRVAFVFVERGDH